MVFTLLSKNQGGEGNCITAWTLYLKKKSQYEDTEACTTRQVKNSIAAWIGLFNKWSVKNGTEKHTAVK